MSMLRLIRPETQEELDERYEALKRRLHNLSNGILLDAMQKKHFIRMIRKDDSD